LGDSDSLDGLGVLAGLDCTGDPDDCPLTPPDELLGGDINTLGCPGDHDDPEPGDLTTLGGTQDGSDDPDPTDLGTVSSIIIEGSGEDPETGEANGWAQEGDFVMFTGELNNVIQITIDGQLYLITIEEVDLDLDFVQFSMEPALPEEERFALFNGESIILDLLSDNLDLYIEINDIAFDEENPVVFMTMIVIPEEGQFSPNDPLLDDNRVNVNYTYEPSDNTYFTWMIVTILLALSITYVIITVIRRQKLKKEIRTMKTRKQLNIITQ